MSSDDDTLFDKILPFDNMEGEAAAVLGRFVKYVRSLHAVASDLGRPRTLLQWIETLRTIQRDFFKTSKEVAMEYNSIGKVIDPLEKIDKHSGYTD
ncbi:MAG: exodeoxyribonuclease V subunit gamma [Deltaproteobacteria bacterium]|nr:exodeoxyribonuclease V subunit gamma [Deltaproteobacteria bacterium]